MKSKNLSLARLSSEERKAIVETIKSYNFRHKDIVLELFEFIESLLEDLKNSKITLAVLKSRLSGFISEQEKKAQQIL